MDARVVYTEIITFQAGIYYLHCLELQAVMHALKCTLLVLIHCTSEPFTTAIASQHILLMIPHTEELGNEHF